MEFLQKFRTVIVIVRNDSNLCILDIKPHHQNWQ